MAATNAHPPSCDATLWLRETWPAGGASVTILLPSAVANALDIGVDAAARVNHAGGTDIVVDAVVLRDAQGLTDGKRILVGSKILEIPRILSGLQFDAILHVHCGMFAAGIFITVGDDEEDDVLRSSFFLHGGEFHAKRVDGRADGVVQGGATAATVIGHQIFLDISQIGIFDETSAIIGELIEVQYGFAFIFLLRLDERAETAFDVIFDDAHGSGSVQNDADVRVVFHVLLLLLLKVDNAWIINMPIISLRDSIK